MDVCTDQMLSLVSVEHTEIGVSAFLYGFGKSEFSCKITPGPDLLGNVLTPSVGQSSKMNY